MSAARWVGQRMLGTVTRVLIAQFFRALDGRFAPSSRRQELAGGKTSNTIATAERGSLLPVVSQVAGQGPASALAVKRPAPEEVAAQTWQNAAVLSPNASNIDERGVDPALNYLFGKRKQEQSSQ
jgi:hypothetical protein